MPRKIIRYECVKCGFKHSSEPQSKACEEKHLGVKKINSVHYDPVDSKNRYPDWIVVELQNGEKIQYKR